MQKRDRRRQQSASPLMKPVASHALERIAEMNGPAGNGGLATMTLEVLLSPELLQRVKVEFSE
ncbi:hypothetical protein CRUP_002270, partial [Coryphaenoides rupestris]